MTAAPKVNAIAPWFGSKRNLAPAIVEELGSHRAYWEPFCGSLAVLMAKPKSCSETANDLHGDLINLARVLQVESQAVDLCARLQMTIFHETLYEETKDVLHGRPLEDGCCPDVARAEAFMVKSWFGRNGAAGTKKGGHTFCVRYTNNGGAPHTRWQSAVDSIPAWHWRLKNVTMLRRDAFELLPRIDDVPQTAIYCDPPYIDKADQYRHDFSAGEHQQLAEALARFRLARVVVSYYDHPHLAELYPGWRQRKIVVNRAMASQGKRDAQNKALATEVLLVNEKQDSSRPREARLF